MKHLNFTFFIQPIVNSLDNSILRQELLLREVRTSKVVFPSIYWKSLPILDYQQLNSRILKIVTHFLDQSPTQTYSINVSRNSLVSKTFIEELENCLLRYKERLVIELTEEELIDISNLQTKDDLEKKLWIHLEELCALGFYIAIDDVGSGINSLENVLNIVPYVKEIKYSLSNLKKVDSNIDLTIFLLAWQQLAQEKKLNFVVEGIETEKQKKELEDLNIWLHQGYYYGRPKGIQI